MQFLVITIKKLDSVPELALQQIMPVQTFYITINLQSFSKPVTSWQTDCNINLCELSSPKHLPTERWCLVESEL